MANQKPAYVLVYDYYDQSRRARSFYGVDASNLCDISDDSYVNDCGDKKTFLRYESFQFGDNVDFHNSEASTLSFVVSAMAFSLVLSLALIWLTSTHYLSLMALFIWPKCPGKYYQESGT